MKGGTTWRYRLVSAILAFLLWGGWAYLVNPADTAVLSAFVQGSASFTITLIMVELVTCFYNRIALSRKLPVLPALMTVTLTGCFLIFVHKTAQTANILETVTAPLLVGLVFCTVTAYRLKKAETD